MQNYRKKWIFIIFVTNVVFLVKFFSIFIEVRFHYRVITFEQTLTSYVGFFNYFFHDPPKLFVLIVVSWVRREKKKEKDISVLKHTTGNENTETNFRSRMRDISLMWKCGKMDRFLNCRRTYYRAVMFTICNSDKSASTKFRGTFNY